MSKMQLRAIMQILQVLGISRKKLGMDGFLCRADCRSTVHTTCNDVLLQPRVHVTPSNHISWYSLGETAAPELPRSLLQSLSWARLQHGLSGNSYMLGDYLSSQMSLKVTGSPHSLGLCLSIYRHLPRGICDVTGQWCLVGWFPALLVNQKHRCSPFLSER